MRRDANTFCPILAWHRLDQTLTTSQICVLERCLLLSAFDMAIYHNTQQKQVFTSKLQLFHVGIILRFIQVLYRSEFLLKTIFWKQNALSSSFLPGEFSPFAFPHSHGNNVKNKPQKLFRGEKRSKTFSDPRASRSEAQICPPRARAVLRAGAFPFIAKASLQGCAQRGAFLRAKVFRCAKRKTRFALVNKQMCSDRLWKPGHPSKTETKPARQQKLPGPGLACSAAAQQLRVPGVQMQTNRLIMWHFLHWFWLLIGYSFPQGDKIFKNKYMKEKVSLY